MVCAEAAMVMQAQRQQQQKACPPIFQAMAPLAHEPQARCMERLASGPVHSRATDPDWVPSQLTRACSEGTTANQGRCKCGEASPPLLQHASPLGHSSKEAVLCSVALGTLSFAWLVQFF